MINIEEARKIGNGVAFRFQENPTYAISKSLTNDGYRCPHCKKYNINVRNEVIDKYEIPKDIEFMQEHSDGYSWTEDIKCGLCGNLYSQDNGC